MSKRRLSAKINTMINDELSNQDHMQRLALVSNVSLELYRVLVSSLLILFVPQDCNGNICTLTDNLNSDNNTYSAGVAFNFLTLFAFICLYGFEIAREDKMIKYLEVNPENPRDNQSVAKIFDKIPTAYKNEIYSLDYYYQKISYVCLVFFIINTGISGRVVYDYSLGNQTSTTFVTNVLFMATKVYDTYYLANTDKSVFYSAYLRDRIQFNDIDPSIKDEIELNNKNNSSELTEHPIIQEIGDLHDLSIKLPEYEKIQDQTDEENLIDKVSIDEENLIEKVSIDEENLIEKVSIDETANSTINNVL
jgi:hypothetical protein